MKKQISIRTFAVCCVAALLIGVLLTAVGIWLRLGNPGNLAEAAKFAKAYEILENQYVGQADMNRAADNAYRIMVESIGDRWSYYMTAEEYDRYLQIQNNAYNGIGIVITTEDGGLPLITKVYKNSPAMEAGVLPGEYIKTMDGDPLGGIDSAEFKALISGKNGEEFTLELVGEDGVSRTVDLRAREIFTDPVEYEMLEGGIAYIKIANFERSSSERTITALNELIDQGAKAVVFDVRNNYGGLLNELTSLLDHLLPEGDLFVSLNKQGDEIVSVSDSQCLELPMAVLINENTVSAAEFFAAALSEYEAAFTVGEATTGKSRSQVNISLPDGSVIHLSTKSYLTPKRKDLAREGGLSPDIVVSLDEDTKLLLEMGELALSDDSQLQAAVDKLFQSAVQK